MKKSTSIIFIVLCLVLCLIPSLGMLFFPTTQTTENKPMAPAPKLLTEDGAFNKSFIQDFESYVTEHMALRNQLVYMDARIQTSLFQESNVSGVISGTDGWLYYSSTLDDFLGKNILTDRQLYNLANNFSVIQDYALERDMDFVLTLPPNKNTLYPENMPYYKSHIVDPDHSAKLLAPYLQAQGVHYVDLFTMFEQQDEVLYLLRDSHWNMKGACLAYNAILDSAGIPHRDYSDISPKLVKNENGDLNKMLYSFYGELEENYDYGLTQDYTFEKEGATVEDGWIVTHNPEATGTLLMFRDSFANTLIPFFSNEFATACYSKGIPNAMERFVETYAPDCVVVEKVERNITDYLENPPILTPPLATLPEHLTISKTETTAAVEVSMNDVNYYKFTGTVDPERLEPDSQILVSVNDTVYRAYLTGENDYLLYLKKAEFSLAETDIKIYIINKDNCILALSSTVSLPQE